jgi:hypothetical protein
MSEYCPMCNGFEREVAKLRTDLASALARAEAAEKLAWAWDTLALETMHHYSMPKWVDGKYRVYFGPMGLEVIATDTAGEAALLVCFRLGLKPVEPLDKAGGRNG